MCPQTETNNPNICLLSCFGLSEAPSCLRLFDLPSLCGILSRSGCGAGVSEEEAGAERLHTYIFWVAEFGRAVKPNQSPASSLGIIQNAIHI